MTPWSPQSPRGPSVSLISCVITGIIILITCSIILYLVKIRKQQSSIRSLRIHNYERNCFPLFLFRKDKDVVE
jgi:hypothetical protein